MKKSTFFYIDKFLENKVVTYGELIQLLNELAKYISDDIFFECQIASEKAIIKNSDLLTLPIDTEWDIPTITISKSLVWNYKEKEKLINIEELSKDLIAISYNQEDEFFLTILSKKVYTTRCVTEEILELSIQISEGDIDLLYGDKYFGKKFFKEIVEYLNGSGYIFIVRKKIVGNMEYIMMEPSIDWKQQNNYSFEFTKKGREGYLNNELGLDLMKFIS